MTVYGQHLTFCLLAGMFQHLLLLLETHITFQLSEAQSGSFPSPVCFQPWASLEIEA